MERVDGYGVDSGGKKRLALYLEDTEQQGGSKKVRHDLSLCFHGKEPETEVAMQPRLEI